MDSGTDPQPRRTLEGRVLIDGPGWHHFGSAQVEHADTLSTWAFTADFNEVRYSDGLLAAWPRTYAFTQEYRVRDVNPEALALLFGFTWNEVMDRMHPHIERGEN